MTFLRCAIAGMGCCLCPPGYAPSPRRRPGISVILRCHCPPASYRQLRYRREHPQRCPSAPDGPPAVSDIVYIIFAIYANNRDDKRRSTVRTRDQEEFQRKKIMLMEKCYDCYAENGLASVGIRKLAESCGCSSAVLYIYFRDLDDLIVQSTAYCMKKVEDDFMAKAPTDPQDLMRFIDEIPYWTARQHGKKYRLMYQVYTHPKYIRYGKQFFEGVNRRYTEWPASAPPAGTADSIHPRTWRSGRRSGSG